MNIEEFQDFTDQIRERAGFPRPDFPNGGMLQEIQMGWDSGFVDGDGPTTIDNMQNLIDELQHELRDIENAMQRVIDDGEMGL